MHESLLRLSQLPGDTKVLPGHDAPTTIDHERRFGLLEY
jgi:glyoxylase-like metal-dependent hydrolase (beta-lactamase superfamily II)